MYGTFAVALAALLTSAASLTTAFNTIAYQRDQSLEQAQTLQQIDRDSAVAKAKFERYAEQGDGLSLTGYNCDPENVPQFDSMPWAKAEPRAVTSSDGYHVGDVMPDGSYRHFGYCSK